MNVIGRWVVMFVVMFPFVMIINQCGYNNCYRADCVAAAMSPVTMWTLILSFVVAVVFASSQRK